MHFIRPELTYQLGIRQPIGQFSPHHTIMHNVGAFTRGPMMFQQGSGAMPASVAASSSAQTPAQASATGMSGALGRPSLLQRIRRALKSRAGGRTFHPNLRGPAGDFYPYGPESWAGGKVVPFAAQRAQMLVQMGAKNVPSEFSPITSGLGFIYRR